MFLKTSAILGTDPSAPRGSPVYLSRVLVGLVSKENHIRRDAYPGSCISSSRVTLPRTVILCSSRTLTSAAILDAGARVKTV